MIQQLSGTVHKIKTSKREIILQIFLVFILPVLLLQAGVLPIGWRFGVLVGTISVFVYILHKERWTASMLHIELKNFKKFLLPYLVFTLIGVLALSSFGEKLGREEFAKWWTSSHFLYLFFIVSVFQEVAFRGYLIPALRKIVTSPIAVILFNALLFTYMHSIFPSLLINLPIAFVGGICFAIMYIRYPNLLLVILSHAVLNFTAVLYGFFVIS